ncbi:MAG: hypothetical protein AB7S26_14790 [Sandaracinaceae bacterium]
MRVIDMRVIDLVLAIALSLSCVGCFGTETGNPSVALMAIDAHSTDPMSVSVRGSDGIVVDAAWISFGQVGLVPAGSCPSADGERTSDALGTGDHSEPGSVRFDIELANEASFCELTVPFTVLDGTLPAGAPAELAGRAMVVLGHLPDGTELRIVSGFSGEVTVTPDTDPTFALTADEPGLLVGLDVSRWIVAADLGGADREPDGSIVLDDTRNTAARDAFDARVASGVELYRDEGADGVLDAVPVLIGRGE